MKKVIFILMLMSSTAYGQGVFKEGLQPSPGPFNNQFQNPNNNESTPKPDPTRITTEAIAALKQQLLELFGTKFDGVQKDTDEIRSRLDNRQQQIDEALAHLEKLMNEKFKGVDQQFAGRDTALAAALLAQKTSVDEQNKSNAASATKSEVGFEKRIESIAFLITAQSQAADSKISDLKDRLTAIESRGEGAGSTVNWIIAGVGFLLTMLSIVGTVVALMKSNQAAVVAVNGKR